MTDRKPETKIIIKKSTRPDGAGSEDFTIDVAPAPESNRPHHLNWNGTEWVDSRCGCRYHPDDDNGSHGGAPHVHPCEKHAPGAESDLSVTPAPESDRERHARLVAESGGCSWCADGDEDACARIGTKHSFTDAGRLALRALKAEARHQEGRVWEEAKKAYQSLQEDERLALEDGDDVAFHLASGQSMGVRALMVSLGFEDLNKVFPIDHAAEAAIASRTDRHLSETQTKRPKELK